MLNPGIGVPQCYENAADVIVTFEGSYASYVGDPTAANPYTPLTWTTTDPMKIWHIVYGAPDAATMAQATALSKTRGAGYIYVTDDVLANPYDTLPPPDYWAAELATMAGAPGTNKPPTRPVGLDTVEVYGTTSGPRLGRFARPRSGRRVRHLPRRDLDRFGARHHSQVLGRRPHARGRHTCSLWLRATYGIDRARPAIRCRGDRRDATAIRASRWSVSRPS